MSKSRKSRAPKSLKAYIQLCKRYGGVTVKRKHSRKAGNCGGETDEFITAALGGRTEVPLRDLIPWIRRNHENWDEVIKVTDYVLVKIGVLPKGFKSKRQGIHAPWKTRPDAF